MLNELYKNRCEVLEREERKSAIVSLNDKYKALRSLIYLTDEKYKEILTLSDMTENLWEDMSSE